MAQEDTAADQPGHARAPRSGDSLLMYAGQRFWLRGRALRLILWVATHQQQINEVAGERGQLWLTWKGSGPNSIEGNLKVPL